MEEVTIQRQAPGWAQRLLGVGTNRPPGVAALIL